MLPRLDSNILPQSMPCPVPATAVCAPALCDSQGYAGYRDLSCFIFTQNSLRFCFVLRRNELLNHMKRCWFQNPKIITFLCSIECGLFCFVFPSLTTAVMCSTKSNLGESFGQFLDSMWQWDVRIGWKELLLLWRSHSCCWVVIPIGFMTAALVMFAAAIQEKQTSKTLWDTNTNRSKGC